MQHLCDEDLIHAYLRGDERAFEVLVQRYLTPIYRFLVRLVHEKELAEDLTQETFVRAWKKFSSFDPKRSFKTWLFSIAKYAAFDALKKKQPIRFSELEQKDHEAVAFADTIPDERPLPEVILIQEEQVARLEEVLETLSYSAKTVVLMHDIEQLTFQEIAEVLSEPLNTVKSRYRRAFLLLQQTLGSFESDDAPKNGS